LDQAPLAAVADTGLGLLEVTGAEDVERGGVLGGVQASQR
jgi:hypothetical protein